LAQLTKRLPIIPVQPVQQLPAACISQSAKHRILTHDNDMEPFGYLF
jgi:hypothetical protein